MKVIRTWDLKDYDPNWRRFVRRASRAIIYQGTKVAMVRSETEGFYLFPGGGVKRGESRIAALIRETLEETGLVIIRSTVKEMGMFREVRRSIYQNEIFDQRSYYYTAQVEPQAAATRLEPYERACAMSTPTPLSGRTSRSPGARGAAPSSVNPRCSAPSATGASAASETAPDRPTAR